MACPHSVSIETTWFVLDIAALQPGATEEAELKAGKFGVIRSLLRALDGGTAAKAVLDAVIDACAAMQVGCCMGMLPTRVGDVSKVCHVSGRRTSFALTLGG
jgi:hypothetical protein